MRYNAHSHELLAIVPAVHHERIGKPLDDGALRFSKAFDGETTSGVRDVDGLADLDVVAVHLKVSDD